MPPPPPPPPDGLVNFSGFEAAFGGGVPQGGGGGRRWCSHTTNPRPAGAGRWRSNASGCRGRSRASACVHIAAALSALIGYLIPGAHAPLMFCRKGPMVFYWPLTSICVMCCACHCSAIPLFSTQGSTLQSGPSLAHLCLSRPKKWPKTVKPSDTLRPYAEVTCFPRVERHNARHRASNGRQDPCHWSRCARLCFGFTAPLPPSFHTGRMPRAQPRPHRRPD